jgi:uncharacterized protein
MHILSMLMSADLVFSYTFLLCVIAYACAIPTYFLIRKNSPKLNWHRHGNTCTSQFNQLDIFGVGLFLLIFGATLTLAQAPPELGPDGNPKEIRMTPSIMLVGMISQQIVFTLIVFALMMFRGTNFGDLLGLNPSKVVRILVISMLGFAAFYIFGVVLHILGYEEWLKNIFGSDYKVQETIKTFQATDAATIRIMMAFTVAILAPLCEEVLFRGYIYGATKRFSDRFFACLFSSLLFAVVHYNINALIPLFFLAIVLTIAYELTGSIWAPIIIHALVNANTLIMIEFGNATAN